MGLAFGVWGLGFGVWGLGFGVWGLGFGVWGWDSGLYGFKRLKDWGGLAGGEVMQMRGVTGRGGGDTVDGFELLVLRSEVLGFIVWVVEGWCVALAV